MNGIIMSSPLFRGVKNDELEGLFKKIHYQIKEYGKNQLIVQMDEECKNLMNLIEGSVKGEMMDFAGRTIKIEDISAPKPLASAFLFGRHNRYPVNIVTNEKVKLLILPKESVLRLMQLNQQFLNNFLDNISSRTQFLSQKIKFLSFKTIKGKIAHFILQQSGNKENMILFRQTQQQMAELFGVTRPSFARALKELEDEKIIKAKNKEIEIINKFKLNELLDE